MVSYLFFYGNSSKTSKICFHLNSTRYLDTVLIRNVYLFNRVEPFLIKFDHLILRCWWCHCHRRFIFSIFHPLNDGWLIQIVHLFLQSPEKCSFCICYSRKLKFSWSVLVHVWGNLFLQRFKNNPRCFNLNSTSRMKWKKYLCDDIRFFLIIYNFSLSWYTFLTRDWSAAECSQRDKIEKYALIILQRLEH